MMTRVMGAVRAWTPSLFWLVTLLTLAVFVATGCITAVAPPSLASLPPAPTPTLVATPTSQGGGELAAIPFAEQLRSVSVPVRNMSQLRARLVPLDSGAPLPLPETREYVLGDRLDFWVHNASTAQNSRVTAELVHKTAVAYAWVEVGQEYERRMVRQAIDEFSTRIYPAVVRAFGRENSPGVDGDVRLHVLHTTGMGPGVAGYFLGADQNLPSAIPYSNAKEMFYINLEWLNRLPSVERYETTLAHEFQHMIHYAHDRNEEVWINEGLSVFSQETAGFAREVAFPITFASAPGTQLNTWAEGAGSNYSHYGGSYLFVRYLVDRFGSEIARALVAEAANGVEGVRRVLARPPFNSDFTQVFADWQVALALDKPNALEPGRYGYHELDPTLMTTTPLSVDALAARPAEMTIPNFGTALYLLEDAGDVRLEFAGATETGISAARPASGAAMWWGNRVDDSNARLTNLLDLSGIAAGRPVTMSLSMWWDIEDDYDYAYVTASRDGASWAILPGQRTTELNPSGNSLGHAYTGVSRQVSAAGSGEEQQPEWVTETFDLAVFAGGPLWLRFEYVTDDAVNRPGWLLDDLRIPAIGLTDDFELGSDGWQSEGFLLGDGRLAQEWLVQVVELERGQPVAVRRIAVDGAGRARIEVDDLGGRRSALLFVSGMTEGSTEEATYTLSRAN